MAPSPPDMFLGLTATGWAAVSSIVAIVGICLTLASLVYIARQLGQSRQAHVETLLEGAVRDYLDFRSAVYELDVVRLARSKFSWEQINTLRMVANRCELFFPTILQLRELGTDRRSQQFSSMYQSDIITLSDVVDHAQLAIKADSDKSFADWDQKMISALESCGATAEEIQQYKEYDKEDKDKASSLYSLIRARYLTSEGLSPQDIIERDAKEDSKNKDAFDVMIKHGIDHNPVALRYYWGGELKKIASRLQSLKSSVAKEFGAAHA
ncbi:MAG TPA: hypothetical protein VF559_08725 [Caulobacteraceae bacterium]|jgi:hypothetical protein